MKAEIIAIGTELLLGETVNTNASWMAQQLADVGVDVYHQQVVGDNPARIQAVTQQASERVQLMLTTGGLGPTDDDLTVATLAEYFKAPMESDSEATAWIQSFFKAREIPLPAKNLKQALRPITAVSLQNPLGTAPGLAWDLTNIVGKPFAILCFPGVPRELKALWPVAMAWLETFQTTRLHETPQRLFTRQVRFAGIGESALVEKIGPALMNHPQPTVAPYCGQSEVRIRVASKAPDEASALREMQPLIAQIQAAAPAHYFGMDDTTLEKAVAQALLAQGWRITVAESCTGGLISSRLTDVPGSSEYIHLNVVTYANKAKHHMLKVPESVLDTEGAVSEACAQAMAIGAYGLTQAPVVLATTGIAGPDGGTPEKPVGLMYVACWIPEKQAEPVVGRFLASSHQNRSDLKYNFSQMALLFLLQQLKANA